MTGFDDFFTKKANVLRSELMNEKGEDLTIKGWEKKAPYDEGGPPRLVLHFHEREEAFGLNQTNLKILQSICSDFAGLPGTKINVYVDESVVNPQTKAIGGLRIRKPQVNQGGGNGSGELTMEGPSAAERYEKLLKIVEDASEIDSIVEQAKMDYVDDKLTDEQFHALRRLAKLQKEGCETFN